jgi:LysR family transcriptional regulator, transcriptional activator of nhaA
MEWLNFNHLRYFWAVAREASLVRAAAELRLAPSTLSGQIRLLERQLGVQLFMRVGRGLVLSEPGRVVFRYAEEIFSAGRELQDALGGRTVGRATKVVVGIADVLPKLVASRLLEPLLRSGRTTQLICREDKPARLLAELALHNVDVILSDSPVGPSAPLRAFGHLLGECAVTLFGTPKLAATYRRGFPKSLDAAPLLLPTENTALRRSLDLWFGERGLRPRVVGEFEDSALLKVFGQSGHGLFPAASVIKDEVLRQYQVRVVGELTGVRERFYAISTERRLQEPAVLAITEVARTKLFTELTAAQKG